MTISTKVPKFSNPFEFDMLMQEPVHAMMMHGILLDKELREEVRAETIAKWKKDQEILNSICGFSLNVESKKVVPDLLYNHLNLPKRLSKGKLRADEASLRSLMAECKAKVGELKTVEARERWIQGALICFYILKIRGLRKQISSYLGLSIEKGELAGEAPFEDPDGRVRWTMSVGGTETGRFTHSKTLWDSGMNGATIPDPLRKMFIADEGYEFCEVDLNRGESWVYAHLSRDPELLRIHNDGLDFHSETASAISGAFGKELSVEWINANKKDASFKIRFLGKKVNHASSYQMGPFKGAEVVNSEAEDTGVTCTVAEFKKAQRLWLGKYFMIEQWWKEIEAEINKSRTLVTPYGRIHQFHDQLGESLFKSATAYVPQSTSVDFLNRGLLRAYHEYQVPDAWGLRLLSQTHDSILFQYKKEHRAEAVPSVIESLKSKLVIKGREFCIPAEAKVGQSWGGMKDVKF